MNIFPQLGFALGVLTFFGKALHSWAAMRPEIRVVTRNSRAPPVPPVAHPPGSAGRSGPPPDVETNSPRCGYLFQFFSRNPIFPSHRYLSEPK